MREKRDVFSLDRPLLIAPLADLLIALRFFSRLPVPGSPRERALGDGGLAAAAALVPVAGALIGLVPALALAVAGAVALPSLVVGSCAIVTLVVVTGALHEDALADCADGFGGGATREAKLAIMRDSRVGAYGVCALALSLLVRAAALGAIAERSIALAACVAIAAAAVSRTAALVPLVLLGPARADGLGAAARPSAGALVVAMGLATALTAGALAAWAGPGRIFSALALSIAAALGACELARRQIGGHTGDVAGAAQQVTELAFYLVFAAG